MSNLIRTSELDFSRIKANLKNFLSAQNELTDYDFDGSVLSTLIDVLAYNTHYNALYTNMAVNEMFIDSASKRSSISSISKLLGYVPRSISTSKAMVDITVSSFDNQTNVYNLEPGTVFSTELSGKMYMFNITETVTATKNFLESSFTFRNVPIYEGEKVEITYIQGANTKFIIPESNIDTETIKVSVYNNLAPGAVNYVAAKSLVDTKSTDNVFFIKHIDGNLYELMFGDGIFGTVVPVGNMVRISYLVSNGENANACAVFAYMSGGDPTKSYNIVTTVASAFGAAEEDKESIRYFAPLAYQAQNRAVTANDYAAILSSMYGQIETISVWGGQDNVPPQYGKVFISAKPYGRDLFTVAEKAEFKKGILAKRSVVTVVPEFVDPSYYNVEVIANVYYSLVKSTKSAGAIQNTVRAAIDEYALSLQKFDSSFRHSLLTSLIDKADSSIVSSINTVRIRYTIAPILNIDSDYSIDFKNPIAESNTATFYSTRFLLQGYENRGYLKNDGVDINFYTEDVNGIPFYEKTVGSIDFNGKITLQKLNINALYDDMLEFVFSPSSYDIIPPNGIIVRIPPNRITVNVLVDKLSQVRTAKADHIFSPSR